jgi:hypothetical protein
MAYRMSFEIRGLPDNKPIVSDNDFNSISDSVYQNGKRLTPEQRATPLPYVLCLQWVAFIYSSVFKGKGCEFCPITADYFMIRFFGKPDADKGVSDLKRFISKHKGLEIDISKGG